MPLLVLLLAASLIGCAASPSVPQSIQLAEYLGSASCASDEFRGSGVGKSENEALSIARSDLAMQINSSMKVSNTYRQNQQVFNGSESLSSEYESNLVVESNLQNAQDARVLLVERRPSETGAVVCMAKSDAAKGFLERQRLVMDSLGIVSGTALNTGHPKHKNEAWHRTQMLYNDFIKIQNLLEGWGVKSPYSADEIYTKTRENYKNYCQSVKIFWQDVKNDCSDAVFAIFSRKVKLEKSKCSGGLNLSFYCSERCKSSSYGIECSYEPSLAIEACGGEKYSMLKAPKPVTGSDMYNETKAREDLAKNLQNAAFLNEWENEVKQWVPQCSD